MSSTTREGRHSLLKAPLSYGDQVLVGGIRGKILGGGWVEGVVQKQHPSGRVTVRTHGRNHVVSGKAVLGSARPLPAAVSIILVRAVRANDENGLLMPLLMVQRRS